MVLILDGNSKISTLEGTNLDLFQAFDKIEKSHNADSELPSNSTMDRIRYKEQGFLICFLRLRSFLTEYLIHNVLQTSVS